LQKTHNTLLQKTRHTRLQKTQYTLLQKYTIHNDELKKVKQIYIVITQLLHFKINE
jgi:hypothetical protein